MSTGYSYDAHASARRLPEAAKRAGAQAVIASRSPFERDRARVLHSYAFRRLADKTQVVGPGEDDFPRTRLTHSLEVAQIGREIAAALGANPDIVDTAGLAHDIGHPPFGHNGETALNQLSAGIGGFEGNAQTLRILTRLEAKVLWPEDSPHPGQPAGLNLTRASLDAVCKYPWTREVAQGRGSGKFGVYADDEAAFAWVRAQPAGSAPPGQRRSLEAQIMDWADDVAYSVHDLEDGVHAGLIDIGALDEAQRQAVAEVAAEHYSPLTVDELAPHLDRLLAMPMLRDLAGDDGSYRALAAAKRATSELTGRFATAAIGATRARYGPGALGRYAADLVIDADVIAECALLKAITARYVMHRPGAEQQQRAQRRLLRELVQALTDIGAPALDRALAPSWHGADGDAARLRVVIDQVAQLTDSAAIAWHARLCGPDADRPLDA